MRIEAGTFHSPSQLSPQITSPLNPRNRIINTSQGRSDTSVSLVNGNGYTTSGSPGEESSGRMHLAWIKTRALWAERESDERTRFLVFLILFPPERGKNATQMRNLTMVADFAGYSCQTRRDGGVLTAVRIFGARMTCSKRISTRLWLFEYLISLPN